MNSPSQLAHLHVLITGGLGALGQAVATELTARGARVVLVDASEARDMPHAMHVIGQVDLADEEAAVQAVAKAHAALGQINALVNIAGGFEWRTVADAGLGVWDRLYGMNLRTAASATRAALPYLLEAKPAAIVNVGAAAALKAAAGMGAYAASKAGVAKLTEALAEELKDSQVRVNAVLPSILDTAANRASMPDADPGRWVAPEALARVIAFLLSEEASAVTGASLPVMGRV